MSAEMPQPRRLADALLSKDLEATLAKLPHERTPDEIRTLSQWLATRVPYLRQVEPAEDTLQTHEELLRVPENHILCRQGEAAPWLWVLLRGSVSEWVVNEHADNEFPTHFQELHRYRKLTRGLSVVAPPHQALLDALPDAPKPLVSAQAAAAGTSLAGSDSRLDQRVDESSSSESDSDSDSDDGTGLTVETGGVDSEEEQEVKPKRQGSLMSLAIGASQSQPSQTDDLDATPTIQPVSAESGIPGMPKRSPSSFALGRSRFRRTQSRLTLTIDKSMMGGGRPGRTIDEGTMPVTPRTPNTPRTPRPHEPMTPRARSRKSSFGGSFSASSTASNESPTTSAREDKRTVLASTLVRQRSMPSVESLTGELDLLASGSSAFTPTARSLRRSSLAAARSGSSQGLLQYQHLGASGRGRAVEGTRQFVAIVRSSDAKPVLGEVNLLDRDRMCHYTIKTEEESVLLVIDDYTFDRALGSRIRDLCSRKLRGLQSLDIFQRMNKKHLRRLTTCFDLHTLRAGDVLFRQGEVCQHIFFITRGRIEVQQSVPVDLTLPKGFQNSVLKMHGVSKNTFEDEAAMHETVTLAELGPGDVAGDVAAFASDSKRHPYTLIVRAGAEVLMISRHQLTRRIRSDLTHSIRASALAKRRWRQRRLAQLVAAAGAAKRTSKYAQPRVSGSAPSALSTTRVLRPSIARMLAWSEDTAARHGIARGSNGSRRRRLKSPEEHSQESPRTSFAHRFQPLPSASAAICASVWRKHPTRRRRRKPTSADAVLPAKDPPNALSSFMPSLHPLTPPRLSVRPRLSFPLRMSLRQHATAHPPSAPRPPARSRPPTARPMSRSARLHQRLADSPTKARQRAADRLAQLSLDPTYSIASSFLETLS